MRQYDFLLSGVVLRCFFTQTFFTVSLFALEVSDDHSFDRKIVVRAFFTALYFSLRTFDYRSINECSLS